jgi:hypothetical protein
MNEALSLFKGLILAVWVVSDDRVDRADQERMRRTRENAALRIKNITPVTPVTRPGWLKSSVKKRRKIVFTKLTAQMIMLKVSVLLSIYGQMTLAPIKMIASTSNRAIA